MNEFQIEVLNECYKNFKNRNNSYGITLDKLPVEEKSKIFSDLGFLKDKGLISYIAISTALAKLKLTPYGVDFIENGFREPEHTHVINQGANSIYVNGSNNTISDNYNQICADISNSDLPEDCKELIETFLYEMKNPNLTPEKKSQKVTKFLSDISSGTLAKVASSGLATLLTSLFKHLSF